MPYDQWRLSLGVGSGYRWLTPYGNLGVGGGLRIGMVLNAFDSDLYRPFDPILREQNDSWSPSTSIWGSVSLDQRDVYYDPSRGYYGIQRLGYYGILPFEQEHYIRTDTKLEWFYTLLDFPLTDNWNLKAVFGVHTGLSFILRQPQYDRPLIEEASSLAVDGMFIGRGWTTEYRRKGFALWENWAEVRIPLVPGILAWDFFFDAAGIKKTPQALFTEFFADDGSHAGSDTFFMRFSFGGGVRFSIPMFPFRFSVAKRFLYQDGKVNWLSGGIGGSGFDFVVSFAISTY
jgi:outer membrane protein insertion porin family